MDGRGGCPLLSTSEFETKFPPPPSLTGIDSDCQYFLIVWKTFPFLSFYQFAAFLPWGHEGLEILEVLVKVHHIRLDI